MLLKFSAWCCEDASVPLRFDRRTGDLSETCYFYGIEELRLVKTLWMTGLTLKCALYVGIFTASRIFVR